MSVNLTCPFDMWDPIIHGAVSGTTIMLCIMATPTAGLACTFTTLSIADMASHVYNQFIASEDHKLITKLISEDCGGLSEMSKNIEGCYRKYAIEAICRQKQSPNYSVLEYRFLECFANRPEFPCNDWFLRTDVFV